MTTKTNSVRGAAALIIAAMAIIGVIDNYVRFIAEDAGLWQFHAVRSAMALICLGGVGLVMGWRWRMVRPWAVLIRSLLMGSAILLYFGALAALPIATAGAGLFTSPIFVLMISALLLGERIGPWRILAVGLGFAGMLLILKPGGSAFEAVAIIPIAAGAIYACASLATRRLCAEESPQVLTGAFFLTIGVFGLIGIAILGTASGQSFFHTGWQPMTERFLYLTAMQAVGSLIAVGFLVRAYQIADPSYTAIFEYSFLIFAGLWAFRAFGERPDAVSLAGIVLIVAAGAVILLRGAQRAAEN
ncbi:MAG: DMT family transporter [Dinoroseobacter sp.]|nr:DMT family transporter [Dinoroseobacter sp.]